MSVVVVFNHQFDGFIIGRFDESYLMTEVIIIKLGLRTSFSFCYCLMILAYFMQSRVTFAVTGGTSGSR